MQIHSVEQFTFNEGRYITEASDLGWPPGKIARELGIQHRSGVVARFTLVKVQEEQFEYKSILGKDRVIVFND
jgi:hypothetical protein